MMPKTIRLLTLPAIGLAVSLAAGCASKGETTEEPSASTADQAIEAAQEAQQIAREARETATEAKNSAQEAKQSAEDAQACCNTNTERLDRMFEQSQSK